MMCTGCKALKDTLYVNLTVKHEENIFCIETNVINVNYCSE